MNYKILSVDDEEEICKIIDKFLTKKGFLVLTAQSGEEALEIIDKEKPDLVVLDKKMPGIGGEGVLKELKKRNSDIPVILLSGSYDAEDHINEIRAMGYDNILIKPVDLNVLLEAIEKELKPK